MLASSEFLCAMSGATPRRDPRSLEAWRFDPAPIASARVLLLGATTGDRRLELMTGSCPSSSAAAGGGCLSNFARRFSGEWVRLTRLATSNAVVKTVTRRPLSTARIRATFLRRGNARSATGKLRSAEVRKSPTGSSRSSAGPASGGTKALSSAIGGEKAGFEMEPVRVLLRELVQGSTG